MSKHFDPFIVLVVYICVGVCVDEGQVSRQRVKNERKKRAVFPCLSCYKIKET